MARDSEGIRPARKPIRAGSRLIGPGQPCFIAAEIGINHNGDLELAKEMVRAAAKAGADGVKFQNYRTEDFIFDRHLTYTYVSQGKEVTETQWEMFRRSEMKAGWIPELKKLCDSVGVEFFSTPTSETGVRELVDAGTVLLKNGSDYLTHTPLLEFMGGTGIPVVISTGMADLQDVRAAIEAVRRGGKSDLVVLHCTSAYPTKPEDTNLRRMVSLREQFDVPIGFSDHTQGWVAAVQAVTMGACFVEKHFTTSRELPGPDQWFSSTPEEFATLVREIRDAERRLGDGQIVPASGEMENRAGARLSCVAARDLRSGHRLEQEDIAYSRPGNGMPPGETSRIVGQRLRHDVAKGTILQEHDLVSAE